MFKLPFLTFAALMMASCATAAEPMPDCPLKIDTGDYCAFDSRRDAKLDVEIAQSVAAKEDLKSLIVMGANWCHDSRALAGHFEKDRFKALIAEHYRLVYVDVGQKNRNLDIARQFGLETIVGTPTVIITSQAGEVLNLESAPSWRNAASRSEDEIYAYFEDYALTD